MRLSLTTESQIERAIVQYYESSHNVELKHFMADLGMFGNASLEILEEEEKKILQNSNLMQSNLLLLKL